MASPFAATRWVLTGTIGFRVLAIFGQIIILRLVTKEAFGTYRGLIDLLMIALPLLPMSFDALLIREKKRKLRYEVALAMVLTVIGSALAAVVLLATLLPLPGAGSFAARLVSQDASPWVVLLLAPTLLLMATKMAARSVHTAHLNFRRISIGEFGNGIITFFGGAALAYFSGTVLALMVAYIAGEVFECFWVFRGMKFKPMMVLHPRRWRMVGTLFQRHKRFAVLNTADLVTNNFGSMIPGPMIVALIGATANADFSAARQLIQLPILLLVGAIWRVAYPTLSGVSEALLQHRCLRIIGTTAAFISPAVIWLAFFAPQTALLVGGRDYSSAAVLIQWMAAYMLLTAIYSPISSIDMIRDRPEIGLYWNIVHTAARVGVIFWTAPMGVEAVVKWMSISSFLLWTVWIVILGWLVGAPWGKYFGAVLRFAPLWLALLGSFWLCDLIVGVHPLAPLLLSALPCLLYAAVVMKFYPGESEMVWKLLGKSQASREKT